MEFINRKEELKRLKRLSEQPKSALAVIWGRRRMGKTRLLLEWVDDQKGVYYAADESAASIQRKYFALALESILPQFSQVEYPDWTSFFSRLAREAEQVKWRGPLVIDELPYLISVSPELPSVLQKFIDHDAKKGKLIVALSGSSQRMMQGAVLDASAPLYGRADEIIKLGPITPNYMKEALKIEDPLELITWYSVLGGIPRYWEFLENRQLDFYEAIDQLVLNPMGPLNDEPNRLLLEELPSAIHLRPILDAIGLGANRLSEIASRIGQPATSLFRPIQRLMELDLVQKEVPYGESLHNSKKTLYKIKDPFIRFWFTLVAPKKSMFAQATSSTRKRWLKEVMPSLVSATWEELCRSAIPLLSEKWGKEFFGKAGRYWHHQGAEWDIISESENRSTLLLGEAKWVKTPISAATVEKMFGELKKKGIPPLNRHRNVRIKYLLFLPEKPKQGTFSEEIKIVDAATLLEAFDG